MTRELSRAGIAYFFIFIFNRTPTRAGWWAYTVLAGSVIGCAGNVMFIRAGPAGTVDYVISVVSAVCWAIVAAVLALNIFGASRA
jgi:dolichyl-phosphate-mannose--protein O-mannosyl transferase